MNLAVAAMVAVVAVVPAVVAMTAMIVGAVVRLVAIVIVPAALVSPAPAIYSPIPPAHNRCPPTILPMLLALHRQRRYWRQGDRQWDGQRGQRELRGWRKDKRWDDRGWQVHWYGQLGLHSIVLGGALGGVFGGSSDPPTFDNGDFVLHCMVGMRSCVHSAAK